MDTLFRRRDASPIFTYKDILANNPPHNHVRYEEKEMLQNGFFDEEVDGKKVRRCKINRVPILSTAEVEVVAAPSPSFIYVRITNHIRDSLIVREPSTLAPLEEWELSEFYYVLCPIEERAYGRARILKIEPDPVNPDTKLVQLILIDDGVIVWANSSSLVSMDPDRSEAAKNLAYHPWQIQAVSLAGIHPKKTPTNRDRMWSENVRKRLQKIINGFNKFKLKAVVQSVTTNDYGVAAVVSLFGIHVQKDKEDKENDKEKKEKETEVVKKKNPNAYVIAEEADIGSLLAGSFPTEIEIMKMYDGKRQEKFERRLSQEEKRHESTANQFIEEFRKQCIPNWRREVKEDEQRPDDWLKPLGDVVIPDMTLDWMRKEGYEWETRLFVSLEGSHTLSPFEFYGRPIKMFVDKREDEVMEGERAKGVEIDITPNEMNALTIGDKGGGDTESKPQKLIRVKLGESEAIIRGDNILKAHADALDLFYNKDGNRKQVTREEIIRVLSDGKRAFMMCQASEARAEYTGSWQRAEVLRAQEFSVTVRFLDSGGTDMVMYGSLFHIHPEHTLWPTLCVQLCVHGLRLEAEKDETWIDGGASKKKSESIEGFKQMLREDLPMSLSVLEEWQVNRDSFRPPSLEHIPIGYERGGVLFVTDMKVQGKTLNYMNEMCTSGWARRDPNSPFTPNILQ